jgi:hypothetical protein
MPTSDFHQISDVLHVVEQCQPMRVLDIGVGLGKWGVLCREILEVYKNRVHRESWQTHIDGVEVHEAYRNDLWRFAYDQVHVGDVREVLPTLGHYDLALCCDVIEHFEKPVGRLLLRQMLDHATRVIVTSPRGHAPQGVKYDNIHETHLSGWDESDFDGLPHLYKDVGFTFLAVLASNQDALESVELLDPLKVLGVRRGTAELVRLIGHRARQRMSIA